MARNHKTLIGVAASLLILATAPALAQDDAGGSSFSGRMLVGFRVVDVGGSETKFKEDINLDDGPRLFNLSFDLSPSAEGKKLLDQLTVDVDNFGGDPFETLHIGAKKFGAFDFQYNRSKSLYFFDDVILPADQANPRLSNAGDFHTFDFQRVRDRATLNIQLTDAAKLRFGFDRYDKQGKSTTTLDIQRDEFELEKPLDESLNDYTLGFEYAWGKTTLVLEERFRDYENLYEIFLPGQSLGEDPGNNTVLDFFFLDQPYSFNSFEHTVRVLTRPTSKLSLRLAASLQNLNLDVDASESSGGTGFNGAPFTTSVLGSGDIQRDTELYDAELTYAFTDRVAFVGRVRQNNLDQEGTFDFGGSDNRGSWDIETTGFEAGFQFAVSPEVTVSAGLIDETRDVTFGHSEDGAPDLEKESTDNTGYYFRLGWRPTKEARLDVEAEDASYNDPFTLASPTDRKRYRVVGRYQWENGVYGLASYQRMDYSNSNSGWDASRDQADLRFGYRGKGIDASFGYALAKNDRAIDQLVSYGSTTALFPILYESDADFFDGRFRWMIDERWTWVGEYRHYNNDGSFPVQRDDARTYLEVDLGKSYLLHLGYRNIDYQEDVVGYDDYDAQIGELSVGYRW